MIDGVHDISCNATLQVLVINNSNHHVNFPKGMKIGHLEPAIDDLADTHQQHNHTTDVTRDCQTGFFYTAQVSIRLNHPTTTRLLAKNFQGPIHERQNNHRYHTTYTDVYRHGGLRPHLSETLPRCNETLPMAKGGNR